jgi:NADH-quinone oxidoreductase subunit L
MALSIVLVAIGLGSGWALFGRRPRAAAGDPDPVQAAAPRLFAFLAARMKFDELYAATVVRLGGAAVFLDRRVWGGCVDFVAGLGVLAGRANRSADEKGLNGGFNAGGEGLRSVGTAYSSRQTGETHGYLRAIAVAFVLLAILAIFGGGR